MATKNEHKTVCIRMDIPTWKKLQKLALARSNQLEQRVSMNAVVLYLIDQESKRGSAASPKSRKS
jgi:hypothetical protein